MIAMQFYNAPYRWGENGPFEFDCSGLVLRCMREVGFSIKDMTAQSLYNWFLINNHQSCEPKEDCILFFGVNDKNIRHVAIAISKDRMIEAGGAGKESVGMSPEDLAKIDARVRNKSINNRRDLVACFKLNY